MSHYITTEQFYDWIAYALVEPWGPMRDDLRFEAFRQRLLAPDVDVRACYPYWPVNELAITEQEVAELRAQAARCADMIERGPDGVYRVKQGCDPWQRPSRV